MKKTALPLLLLLLAAPQQACVKAGGEESQPSFVISPDPAVAVISVVVSGGSIRYLYETSLYGDGRLVRTVYHQQTVRSSEEVELSFQELEDLVRIAVQGDLMEWQEEEFDQQVRRSLGGNRLAQSSDAPTHQVIVRLDEYRDREGEVTSPAEVRIATQPPRFMKSSNPGLDLKEVDALIALESSLDAYFKESGGGGS